MGYTEEAIRKLNTTGVQEQLRYLYGSDEAALEEQTKRYAGLLRRHAEVFGEQTGVQLDEQRSAATIQTITTGGCLRRRSTLTPCAP